MGQNASCPRGSIGTSLVEPDEPARRRPERACTLFGNSMDDRDFSRYSQCLDRVEPVASALYRLLVDLIAARISSDDTARQLDSDLLALLVEEDQAVLDTRLLTTTLESSLFSIQALESETPVEPLIDVMTTTARRIVADVPDGDRRTPLRLNGPVLDELFGSERSRQHECRKGDGASDWF